jgi:hypothetical protein
MVVVALSTARGQNKLLKQLAAAAALAIVWVPSSAKTKDLEAITTIVLNRGTP